jgi:hypothetical protein
MARKVQDWTGALKGPGAAKAGQVERPTLGLNIPKPLLSELWELSVRLRRETGRRVTQTDLVIEALGLLFTKYQRKQ